MYSKAAKVLALVRTHYLNAPAPGRKRGRQKSRACALTGRMAGAKIRETQSQGPERGLEGSGAICRSDGGCLAGGRVLYQLWWR